MCACQLTIDIDPVSLNAREKNEEQGDKCHRYAEALSEYPEPSGIPAVVDLLLIAPDDLLLLGSYGPDHFDLVAVDVAHNLAEYVLFVDELVAVRLDVLQEERVYFAAVRVGKEFGALFQQHVASLYLQLFEVAIRWIGQC